MILRTLLFALALTGCRTEPTPEPAVTPLADSTPGQGAAPAASVGAPALALDAEGFRVMDPASGAARPVAFGTAEADAIAAVTRLRGAPAEQGTNTECGAGPLAYASWADGLTLHASEGTFAGWSVSAPPSGTAGAYTTMAGLGIGTTRAGLDAAYTAEVSETTLGTEFQAGELFGLLDGPAPDAKVTFLWAGTSCNFR